MTKSNGITSLKQAAKLLNKHSPDGESLAYINPEEAKLLRSHGGSGIMTVAGVPSYWELPSWAKPFVQPAINWGLEKLGLGGGNKPTPGQEQDPAWRTPPYVPQSTVSSPMSYLNQPIGQNFNYSTGTEYMDPYYQEQPSVYQDAIMRGETGVKGDSGANPFWQDIGSSIFKSGKDFLTGRYGGKDAIKNIGKDALGVWTFLKAKKDTEGLNADEMKVFDELTQRTEAAQAEFTSNIAGGGVQNVPTDVSRFTEVDLPDMITTPTAAQGGRIGAFNGGIQGLMPQQGMPQQGFMPQQAMPQQGFMPQQGMPPQGLNPRMGYAEAGDVDKDRPWVPSFMDKILNRMEGSAAQLEEVMGETEAPVSIPAEEKIPDPKVQPYWNPKTKEWESVGWETGTQFNYAKAHSEQTGWSPQLFDLIRAAQAGGATSEEIAKDLYADLSRNDSWRKEMGVTQYGGELMDTLKRYTTYKYPYVEKAQGGRIGYNLGGIDRPFQGIGALNRMGYGEGDIADYIPQEERKDPYEAAEEVGLSDLFRHQ